MLIDYLPIFYHHPGSWHDMLWFIMPVVLLTWFRKKQRENQGE
tara:strand:- start:634 stop:762 length:129 start_codon:yes stop_codon:yes gene_type:complete